MPELPEVETIRKDLIEKVLGKEIVSVEVLLDRVYQNPEMIDVKGVVKNISRIGKYLSVDVKGCCTLFVHLRMTGKLVYVKTSANYDLKSPPASTHPYPSKGGNIGGNHIRVIFHFKTGDCLLFQDVRTFGLIEVMPYKTQLADMKNIGVDALSPEFTVEYLSKLCSLKSSPVKTLLLDQAKIAGIGNIYVQEILFCAGVSPLRLANSLKDFEIEKIWRFTLEILELALKHNGTSISDFRRVDDKKGEFQDFLKVYGKKTCSVCGRELLKIKQAGRSTSYCGGCQV